MKKLYMLLLIVAALVSGGLIGNLVAGTPLQFLDYERVFQFLRDGDVVNTSFFKLNFGFYIRANVAQIFFLLFAVFIYCKTAPKIFTGK